MAYRRQLQKCTLNSSEIRDSEGKCPLAKFGSQSRQLTFHWTRRAQFRLRDADAERWYGGSWRQVVSVLPSMAYQNAESVGHVTRKWPRNAEVTWSRALRREVSLAAACWFPVLGRSINSIDVDTTEMLNLENRSVATGILLQYDVKYWLGPITCQYEQWSPRRWWFIITVVQRLSRSYF